MNWIYLDNLELLGGEWLSAAVGLGITYVVFIMGVPALVFQTFIPDYLRGIYNKRFPINWQPFYVQMGIIIALFVFGNPWIQYQVNAHIVVAVCVTIFIVVSVGWLLKTGYNYLKQKFDSTQNIEATLAKSIVDTLIQHFDDTGQLDISCVDDLSTMAKMLPAGKLKNDFLAESERAVEHLLELLPRHKDTKLISELLDKIVSQAITYDGTQFNHENILKTLDLLFLTYNQSNANPAKEEMALGPYLNTTVGNCMKEIGIKAMMKKDLAAVMDVVEKLSALESTAREMFVLGDAALTHGHVTTAVTVTKKLNSKVPQQFNSSGDWSEEDKRNVFFWLGLISKISLLKGSAGEFAQRQLKRVFKLFTDNQLDTNELLRQASRHYYLLADFETIDALEKLKRAKSA